MTRTRDLRSLLDGGTRFAARAADEAYYAGICTRAGIFALERPDRIARIGRSIERHGLLASSIAIGAIRHPDRVAIRDERGELTYRELYEHCNAIANGWRARGIQARDGVAILVRNHRGLLESMFGAVLCGARVILLNTSFAAPQVRAVAEREGTHLLVYDDEFAEMLDGIEPRLGRYRAWIDEPGEQAAPPPPDSLDALIAASDRSSPPKAKRLAKIVILTSGTTGTPKGAPRDAPQSLAIVGSLLSRVPLRAREPTVVATPMFHTLGLLGVVLGLALGSTLVIRRRFDPEATLDDVSNSRATAMIVVPVMLQRMLELDDDAISSRDLSALRVILASGSALGPAMVSRATAAFGPIVYNLYGSTEVAQATVATPADLALDPATVGRPARGTAIKILGEDGREQPTGKTGRIFVGSYAEFDGYTGGGSKDEIGGLMSTGDVGHVDHRGLLFIDGRDDEMIISGGENVFPAEVEELLLSHEGIVEVAAIGVDDERFGQRLKAFVVVRDGAQLSVDDVRSYVRDNLANYKVPRDVEFVSQLPRNATGKVVKWKLAAGDS